jgi:transposase
MLLLLKHGEKQLRGKSKYLLYPENWTVKERKNQWIRDAMRNTYSPDFKAKVVREVLREDKTLSQVAAAHGLHPNLVAPWRDQALTGMASLFSQMQAKDWALKEAAYEQEKQELYAEIGRLTTQLSWLKKNQPCRGGILPDEKRPWL